MKLFKEVFGRFNRQPLRRRLMVFFALLITLPVAVIALQMMHLYREDMVKSASAQMLSALEMSAQRVGQQMYMVEEATSQLMLDKSMAQFFARPEISATQLYKSGSALTSAIAGYLRQEGIDTVMLYTPARVMGAVSSRDSFSLTPEEFRNSSIYQSVGEGEYSLFWVPTYDLAQMYGIRHLKDRESAQPYRRIFSAVRRLNFMYIENNIIHMTPPNALHPILVVNFQASVLEGWIGEAISYPRVRYVIAGREGQVVYDSQGQSELEERFRAYLLGESVYGSSADEAGRGELICATSIGRGGWRLIASVPMEDVMGISTQDALFLMLRWLALMLALSLLLAYAVSMGVTRPVRALLKGVKRFSRGDFDARIQVPADAEFGQLTQAFNDMGGEISTLIHENYEINLKETQAQLNALNLQLNPHFLYNTLNIMNLMAMEEGHAEMTEVIAALSGLLKYALSAKGGLVPLSDEVSWLRNYLKIMDIRFEGMFLVEYDLPEEHMRCMVPKLILQPIVENCFTHGKIGSFPGGRIDVRSEIVEEGLKISVLDNGAGMDADRVYMGMTAQPQREHIGLSNVYRRLGLMYGGAAQVHLANRPEGGSVVSILIPLPHPNTAGGQNR